MSGGIKRKFEIARTDGSSAPGRKHEHCAYFVLDLEHDEFALQALAAYREAARESHPELARDIHEIIKAQKASNRTRCHCREASCPHSLGQAMTLGASDTAHILMNKAKS